MLPAKERVHTQARYLVIEGVATGLILLRTESKHILDSGSKSQQASEEQREVCYLLTSGDQETRELHFFYRKGWILHQRGTCVDFLLLWSL